MKKAIKYFAISILALGILLWATDTWYLLKALRTTYLRGQTGVEIYDFKVQAVKTVKADPGKPWELHPDYNKLPLSDSIQLMHKNLNTTAFLIIKDGKILSEHYYNEGAPDKLSGVWSVTKTYTSLLILKALEDGLIDKLDDPVSKYLPEWNVEQDSTLTVRHLCSMSTGLYWDELEQTPFSLIAKLNFYNDLEKFTLNDLYAVGNPGRKQHYDSGGMQLLGTLLSKVLKDKSISDYLSEKLWQPLCAQNNALYILDSRKHQNEKTYGGLVATARDISRLGHVIADSGKWKGKQILDSAQLKTLTNIPYNNKTYAFGIWTGLYQGKRFYYQSGHLGQFCISFPEHNLVITRFGHNKLPKKHMNAVSPETYIYIKEALRIIEAGKKVTAE